MDVQVGIAIAFAAGIVSFISPCCLPMIPVYVGHLVGTTAGHAGPRPARVPLMLHSVSFVLGLSLIFVGIWASVGFVGYLLKGYVGYLRIFGGLVLILFGLHSLGLLRIPLLYRELRSHADVGSRPRYWRSFALGFIFGGGWTPCIGPVLAGIIGLASLSETAWKGTYLLLAYAAGLGVPFIVTALALSPVTRLFRGVRQYQWAINGFSGVFLIGVGLLMVTNLFIRIPRYLYWGAI